ncbi:discoidin domain-containing protein [Candidatus Saccharibacteria bacterium]|nr:discoidin domain-containing protein [Candidatus Saccharibacteria bacterium]
MAAQVKFYKKNTIDIDNENVTITITDATATNNGQDFVDFMRNRNNSSRWQTTGSNDAANTQIDIDFGEERDIDRIILVLHNFDSYTIQYYNGSTYTDFSTAINVSSGTATTTEHSFNSVTTQLIRIIITATQVTDDDKDLAQLIITESIGQLTGWPQIKKPEYSFNKSEVKMLSGKSFISRQRGNFSMSMSVVNYNVDADIAIFEEIYQSIFGVLVWANAGDNTQFARNNLGFREQDIFLMLPTDEYRPEHYKYCYQLGIKFDIKFTEVVR